MQSALCNDVQKKKAHPFQPLQRPHCFVSFLLCHRLRGDATCFLGSACSRTSFCCTWDSQTAVRCVCWVKEEELLSVSCDCMYTPGPLAKIPQAYRKRIPWVIFYGLLFGIYIFLTRTNSTMQTKESTYEKKGNSQTNNCSRITASNSA